MSEAGTARYDRAPSPEFRELLRSDGFLAPLRKKRKVAGVELDLHLRRGDEVDLCCGLTCLVKSGWDGGDSVRIESSRTYAGQTCANDLFRPGRTRAINREKYLCDVWDLGAVGFAQALDRFLADVQVAARQTREGAVQARWSQTREPWIAFDKEVALEYSSLPERRRHLAGVFREAVDDARGELTALAQRDGWAMPPGPKNSLKLDQLAVDTAGNLVLLEVKDASRGSSNVYYAPFQLLQNAWEWRFAVNSVRRSLQELLDARVELGLTPAHAPPITGGIRAAVGLGEDGRSDKARRRYGQVLEIANAHLPPGIAAVETWVLAEGRQPVRVDRRR